MYFIIKNILWYCCCSVAQSCPTLWPHGLQYARVPCPWPSPWVFSNSRPLSQWYHPIILSSVVPFSSCLQSFPLQGLFYWVGSSHQVAKGLGLQLQHQSFQWTFRVDFLLRLTGLKPLKSKGLSRVLPTPQFKSIDSLVLSLLYGPTHIHTWLLEKP